MWAIVLGALLCAGQALYLNCVNFERLNTGTAHSSLNCKILNSETLNCL